METDQLSRTFAALADPTRRAILGRLSAGEATVGEIAQPFDMTFAAVSKHLRVLERAGLVARGRDAQYRPARLDARPLADASRWIGDYARFWEDSIGTLEIYLNALQQPGDTNKEHPMTEYFTITRTLKAPRALVFDAITRPEHFAVWFGTAAVDVPQDSLTMDVREGGAFAAVMVLPDGNRIDWSGEYLSVDPPAHLAMTLSDQPGEAPGVPVLFDLEEIGGGTRLTIRQERGDFTDEVVQATIAGYNAFIDDLEDVLEALQTA